MWATWFTSNAVLSPFTLKYCYVMSSTKLYILIYLQPSLIMSWLHFYRPFTAISTYTLLLAFTINSYLMNGRCIIVSRFWLDPCCSNRTWHLVQRSPNELLKEPKQTPPARSCSVTVAPIVQSTTDRPSPSYSGSKDPLYGVNQWVNSHDERQTWKN